MDQRLGLARLEVADPMLFINVTAREVILCGITANPTAHWTVQAARNLFMTHGGKFANVKALVRDRGSQFTASFDEVFRTEGIKCSNSGAHTVANSFAERWISTLRREVIDRTIIPNRQQLHRLHQRVEECRMTPRPDFWHPQANTGSANEGKEP